MRINILIGGKAGQGINKISTIVSEILTSEGCYIFNYRDYPSLIRGGHNFNIISISTEKIGSYESELNGIIALDDNTITSHKQELKPNGFVISYEQFKEFGKNLNLALAGALLNVLGIKKEIFIDQINKEFDNEAVIAAVKGFEYEFNIPKFELKSFKKNINILNGSQAIAQGAINSNIDIYFAYPMTPATGVMQELANKQEQNNLIVFQSENEIAVVNAALGASFTGAKVMIGSSGGGFDLMTEGLSFQGQSEIPLVVYLASRPGPGTGIPTYTSQADLNIALYGGHGEFPRIVIAPGDPIECIEKTNEAFYLSYKFNALSIILSDKNLAESEFSVDTKAHEPLKIITNNLVGKEIVKANCYEHDLSGNTIEDAQTAKNNGLTRLKKFQEIKNECTNFEMIKIHGEKSSKNLIVSWGSNKTVILDAIKGEDFKFLQVLYISPMSDEIKDELMKAEKIILIEQNLTGQLGNLIQEKTGIEIPYKILNFDGRPFSSDILKKQLMEIK